MIKEFLNFINQENLFNSKQKILLGVSGGIDSIVMVDLFSRAGLDFGIAHCNFGLRGKESDEDNSFVEKLAQHHNVPIYVKTFDTFNFAKDQSISIQMAARELRITWSEEILLSKNYKYYATAHHLDDQIETILNNFFRGTGIAGLHGIIPKRGNIIHPMLFCFRNQIEEYAHQYQLNYRTDSSNKKTDYTRNKIRHQLIPVIKLIYPNYKKSISENTQRIQHVETIYKNHVQQIADELISEESKYFKISIDKLLHHQPVVMYLYELIKQFGFNYANAEDITNSFDSDSGKYFLSDTYKITKDRTELIIEEKKKEVPFEYLIEKDEYTISEPIKLSLNYSGNTKDFEISKSSSVAHLDFTKLKFPLKLKKWQKGDYFYPLGMTQKKLISDFFIDNKVSVPEKEKTWILFSGDQVIWIIGYRIDNRYKISKSTSNILTIENIEN